MTKTAKEIIRHHLKRVYFNGSTDMAARQNGVIPNDTRLGETQIEVELDQALKELEAIISEQVIGDYRKIGLPTTQNAEQTNYNNKIINQQIGDQRRRLQIALYGKESE